jgi:50S ribosomal subunit-associated GTPase HflX
VWHHCLVRRYGIGQPSSVLAGADVMLVGLFSAKDETFGARLDRLAAMVEAHGGHVVCRHAQRRGVSHGGAAKMSTPYSRRTLLSPGKARELAETCRTAGIGVAVFANPLTTHQRAVLADMFGCPVISGEDILSGSP